MKTQLFAKNTKGETVLLQLSNVEPIKMNLSVAGLDPFNPQSFYSQSFVVPGQGTNGQFFEDVFSVNGTTFNAGVAAQAWINTDGFLFAIGNINLQKVYVNDQYNTVEYEIFFLGDTSDFVQSVGDSYMESIDTTELNHELTYSAVTTSWGATAGGTAGLKDGNVLYPLCEWGYRYDTANNPIDNTLSIGFPRGSTGIAGGSFTNGATAALELTQFKPATRVKWLWDKIMEDAGYTYESEFLNSDLFDQLYMVSDSEARPFQDIQAGLCRVAGPAISMFADPRIRYNMVLNNALSNPDGAFQPTANRWIAPATGTYSFNVSGYFYKPDKNGYPQGAVQIWLRVNGVDVATTGVITTLAYEDPAGFPFYVYFWNLPYTGSLTKDDVVTVQWQPTTFGSVSAVLDGIVFECGDAPDLVVVRSFYPPEGTVKRMDFIKGIATMFNLVFEPSRVSEKSFTIEPWVDWIEGGDKKDWTPFLDTASTIEQEPVFLNRERILLFTGEDDQDLQNEIYQQEFKKNYGYREYNSEIKVITGTQEIKVPFGFTPLQSIPTKTAGAAQPNWIFPTFAKLQPGDPAQNQSGKVQPIQPKPRILFYNGKQPNPVSWYLQNVPAGLTGTAQSQYPLVSPYRQWPPGPTADPNRPQLELTFRSKPDLWSPQSTYTTPVSDDLFTVYWQDWANWIYDPYNRIVRATFRLDPYDVQTLRFNDKIWVKDSWYFVREIKDYPVGEIAKVEVELIKVPEKVIPQILPTGSGPYPGTTCESIAFCNNNPLLAGESTYNYIDCNESEASITLDAQTCASLCALFPLPYSLPTGWTAIRNGDCDGGVYATAGANVEIFLGASGNTFAQSTDNIIYGSTGGSGGTWVPMQYITLDGEDSINFNYNIPFNYAAKVRLVNRNNGAVGITGASVTLFVNGVTAAFQQVTGTYAPVEAIFPYGITGGTTYKSSSVFTY